MFGQKYIAILIVVFSISQSKEIEYLNEKTPPTIYLSEDEVNDLGKMKVGDLLFLLEHNIPVSPQSKKYKNILKAIKRTKEKIIIQNEDMIVVELFGTDKTTNEKIKVMDVIYLFEEKKLIKGPVVKRANKVTIE